MEQVKTQGDAWKDKVAALSKFQGPWVTLARGCGDSIHTRHQIAYDRLYKRGVRHEIKTADSLIYEGRNEAVRLYFGAIPKDDFIVFFDTDVVPPPDTIMRLVSHDLPVVGGLYFMDKPPYWPLLFRKKSPILLVRPLYGETGQYDIVDNWEPGELLKVDAIGMGCTAIRRDVLEKLKYPWFSFAEGTEDLFFCRKVRSLGIPIYCDTSIVCGHLKLETIGEGHYLAFKEAREKGIKSLPAKQIGYMTTREWIPDAEFPKPPKAQMGHIQRRWTKDDTP